MTTGIYCVTSVDSVGCTFLDWSLLWLSGQTKFYSTIDNTWTNLVESPLMTVQDIKNAHLHRRNHKRGKQNTLEMIDSLLTVDPRTGILSMYAGVLDEHQAREDLCFSTTDLHDPTKLKILTTYQQTDYREMSDRLANFYKIPVIFVASDHNVITYRWTDRHLRWTDIDCHESIINNRKLQFQARYFSDSIKRWEDANLVEIWDIRERIALDIRPFEASWKDNFLLDCPHLYINCQDLWFDTQRTLTDIMHQLELPMVADRYRSWCTIAEQWGNIHNDALKFPRMLSRWLHAIIHGHDCALPEFTLQQEAIIQHCLIYHHNLNLKTWNLHKFPSNARDLHDLLEPNPHCVVPYAFRSTS